MAKEKSNNLNLQHQPMRTCVGCGLVRPKKELLRVVRTRNGEIHIDARVRMDGRGAFICPNNSCVQLAQKQHAFARSFRQEVSKDIYKRLLDYLHEK